MSTPEEVLGWMRPALDEMKQGYTADPGTPWEERRESFLNQLGLYDAGQHPVVQELLERLDDMPQDERHRILGSDNELDALAEQLIPEPAAGQEPQPAAGQGEGSAERAYDEQAWQGYLAQNGPQWDGTDATWDQFRQWFEYHAGQQGLGAPATALLDYLAAQPAAERITTFAQYGVTIQTQQDQEETAQPADAEVSAEDIQSIAGDALKAHPEINDMSEDERMKAMSEVLDRL
jgi:hypothetical protein